MSWGFPPIPLILPEEKKGLNYPAQVTVMMGQGQGGQQGRTFHVYFLKGWGTRVRHTLLLAVL